MIRRLRLLGVVPLVAALVAGCISYVDKVDRAAVEPLLNPRAVAAPLNSPTARYSVNAAHYVREVLDEPVSVSRPSLQRLARATVLESRAFQAEHVGRAVESPDYYFIFDVSIRDTNKPWVTSGLILPFFRSREYTVNLNVLDKKGDLFTHYTGTAEVFEARHVFLFWLTPFYLPGRADWRARVAAFEAIAVKVSKDREKFITGNAALPAEKAPAKAPAKEEPKGK